jgi:hypothetical protein
MNLYILQHKNNTQNRGPIISSASSAMLVHDWSYLSIICDICNFNCTLFSAAFNSVFGFAELLTLCIGKRISAGSITGKNQAGQTFEAYQPIYTCKL